MSAQEFFGETDTDNVSETDWDEKKCSNSEGERSGGLGEPEDYYSEAEHNTDSEESSGLNYESGSSFEESRKKKQATKCHVMGKSKAVGSATSKLAAAARVAGKVCKRNLNMLGLAGCPVVAKLPRMLDSCHPRRLS